VNGLTTFKRSWSGVSLLGMIHMVNFTGSFFVPESGEFWESFGCGEVVVFPPPPPHAARLKAITATNINAITFLSIVFFPL